VDEAVRDGQGGVGAQGVTAAEAAFEGGDGDAAEQVDEQDEQAQPGVATDHLEGAVEGAKELALGEEASAGGAGLGGVEGAAALVGVEGQLLSREGVKREARGDLRHPLAAARDDHDLCGEQGAEDARADRDAAADEGPREGGEQRARVALGEDQARGGDVERQPPQDPPKEPCGQGRERSDVAGVEGARQQPDARPQVGGQEQVKRPSRERAEGEAEPSDDGRRHEGGAAREGWGGRGGRGGRALRLGGRCLERRRLRALGWGAHWRPRAHRKPRVGCA
jgi:hypothetical protein